MNNQKKIGYFQIANHYKRDACFDIQINKEGNTMISANIEYMSFFKLFRCNGQMKLLGKIFGEKGAFKLKFMNNSNSLISISLEGTILFWKEEQQARWVQTLEIGHHEGMSDFFLNKHDSLLISGGDDRLIRFWDQQLGWKCSQTLFVNETIKKIKMSENENYVFFVSKKSPGNQLTISIMEKDNYSIWVEFQKIKVNEGYSICSLESNQFAYLPYFENQVIIYEFTEAKQQFTLIKSIKIPQLNSNSLIFIKHTQSQGYLILGKNQYLQYMKVSFSQKQEVDQRIPFFKQCLEKHDVQYLSQNGQFLITLSSHYKYLQINMLKISKIN